MPEYQVRYINPRSGRAKQSETYPNPWVALLKAQRVAAEKLVETYVWEGDTIVVTVHFDGRVVVTL